MQMLIIFLLVQPTFCQFVSTVAGSDGLSFSDGQNVTATFHGPSGLTIDQLGNIYVADTYNNRIRKINATGYVSTVAGTSSAWNSNGQGTSASFNSPQGVVVDLLGNLYVADIYNNAIRKIDATGYVSTFAGSTPGYSDGTLLNAKFGYPQGLALDLKGSLYVADIGSNNIRIISNQYVTTLAGSVIGASGSTDGEGTSALFNGPCGCAVDSFGNTYVADAYNSRIRRINTTGYVSTIAGSYSGYLDGQGTSAIFATPTGVAIDSLGNIYVADKNNHMIRKINATGYVTTIAGSSLGYSDGAASNSQFCSPSGLAFDSLGNLFVADSGNNRIRKITFPLATTSVTSSATISTNLFASNLTVFKVASSMTLKTSSILVLLTTLVSSVTSTRSTSSSSTSTSTLISSSTTSTISTSSISLSTTSTMSTSSVSSSTTSTISTSSISLSTTSAISTSSIISSSTTSISSSTTSTISSTIQSSSTSIYSTSSTTSTAPAKRTGSSFLGTFETLSPTSTAFSLQSPTLTYSALITHVANLVSISPSITPTTSQFNSLTNNQSLLYTKAEFISGLVFGFLSVMAVLSYYRSMQEYDEIDN